MEPIPPPSTNTSAGNQTELRHTQEQGYPLEVVANIAARLLTGDDFNGAARRALRLLDACRETQEEELGNKESMKKFFDGVNKMNQEKQSCDPLLFRSGLKEIYKGRFERNLRKHIIMACHLLDGEEDQIALACQKISFDIKEGFYPSNKDSAIKAYKAAISDWGRISVKHGRACEKVWQELINGYGYTDLEAAKNAVEAARNATKQPRKPVEKKTLDSSKKAVSGNVQASSPRS